MVSSQMVHVSKEAPGYVCISPVSPFHSLTYTELYEFTKLNLVWVDTDSVLL